MGIALCAGFDVVSLIWSSAGQPEGRRYFSSTQRTELRFKRYWVMDIDLTPLKTFATSRPVMYGAPAALALGMILGLMFQVGSQTEPSVYVQAASRAYVEEDANPVAWPSGKVPDHVIGTDFLAEARPRAQAPAVYVEEDYVEEDYVAQYVPASTPAAEAEPTPIVIAARPAYRERPVRQEARWASTDGDILDVRLPDDAPVETALLN